MEIKTYTLLSEALATWRAYSGAIDRWKKENFPPGTKVRSSIPGTTIHGTVQEYPHDCPPDVVIVRVNHSIANMDRPFFNSPFRLEHITKDETPQVQTSAA